MKWENIIPELTPSLEDPFTGLFELIKRYNSKVNLIAKSTVDRAGVKHFCDSYRGLQVVEPLLTPYKPIFDFGAGNGFPGLIAALMWPSSPLILVERNTRKAEFLKMAASELGLQNVEIHGGNVVDLTDQACVNVISRAMCPLPKFLLTTRSVMALQGRAFLFKGDHWSTEFSQVPPPVFESWSVEVGGTYEISPHEGPRFIIQCERLV